jgi:hypothetical protein
MDLTNNEFNIIWDLLEAMRMNDERDLLMIMKMQYFKKAI